MSKQIVLLQSLVATVETVAGLLEQIDEQAAYVRPAPDDWSAADIVQHFIYVEQGLQARLNRIVTEDEPYLPYLHPNEEAHTSTASLPILLTELRASRNQTVAYLNNLKPADWKKTAVHETEGAADLSFFVQMIIDHDKVHISQLINLKEQLQSVVSKQ